MRRSKSVFIVVGLAIALAGATAASQSAGAPLDGRDSRGWTARDAKTKHAWMYVVHFHTDAVSIYDLDAFGTPKIGSIAQGIADPSCAVLDVRGNLYVCNQSGINSDVTIYQPRAKTPTLTLQGLVDPSGLALDTSEQDIFVSDIAHNPNQVALYKAGATSPTRWLERSSADQLAVEAFVSLCICLCPTRSRTKCRSTEPTPRDRSWRSLLMFNI